MLGLHHTGDHCNLLKILFTEIGALWTAEAEKTVDDIGDPLEMTGTHRALHHLRHRPEIKLFTIRIFGSVGENLLNRRGENGCHTGFSEHTEIIFLLTGISGEIIGIIELHGIDEETHDHTVIISHRTLHER